MKKRLTVIFLAIFLLFLGGCSSFPTLEEAFQLSEEEINHKLIGVSQDKIRKEWGEPDSYFSGFYGDIYTDPADEEKCMGIYYHNDDKAIYRITFFGRLK